MAIDFGWDDLSSDVYSVAFTGLCGKNFFLRICPGLYFDCQEIRTSGVVSTGLVVDDLWSGEDLAKEFDVNRRNCILPNVVAIFLDTFGILRSSL